MTDLDIIQDKLPATDTPKAHIERLFQKLIKEKAKLHKLKDSGKYTADIRRQIARCEADIKAQKLTIKKIEKMITFPVGTWVTKDEKKPGKVVNLCVAGNIPEVHVVWSGTTHSVPETPFKLKALDPDELRYIWNGDRNPKLIRIVDHAECCDHDILKDFKTRLSTCLELALDNGSDDSICKEYKVQLVYLNKRLNHIDCLDFQNLERKVKQGITIFFRVGEALAEIKDRKLYKELGYKDFKIYLRERWGMGKSQAYRLISSSEVVNNIQEDLKVSGRGKIKKIPNSEAQTRVLATMPKEKQSEIWEKAIAISDNPTATQIKEIAKDYIEVEPVEPVEPVNDPNFPLHPYAKQLEAKEKDLFVRFEVGQIVRVKSDRTDKRLIGHNQSYGLVTALNPASLDIRIFGETLAAVSPNDLETVPKTRPPTISLSLSLSKMSQALTFFDSVDEIFDTAINARS